MNILLPCMHLSLIYYAFGVGITEIKNKDPNACGLPHGGPLLQRVTKTMFTAPTSLFWKDAEGKLVFADIVGPYICEYEPDDGGKTTSGLIYQLDKKRIHALIPINDKESRYLAATDSDLKEVQFTGDDPSSKWTVKEIMDIYSDTRMYIRKARASKSGKLWIAGDPESRNSSENAELLKVDVPKSKTVVDDKYTDIGGVAWNKNSSCLYTISTRNNCVYRYDFNPDTDTASNRKVLFDLDDFAQVSGNMSSIAVDVKGNLWIALSYSGVLIRYNMELKDIDSILSVPGTLITSITFGGKHYQNLYVAIAKDPAHLNEPGAGALYAYSGTGSYGFAQNYVKIQQ